MGAVGKGRVHFKIFVFKFTKISQMLSSIQQGITHPPLGAPLQTALLAYDHYCMYG